jgi:hypothetical protein
MVRTLLILTLVVAGLTACTSAPSTAPVAGTPQTQTPVGERLATGTAAATPTLPPATAAVTVAPSTATPPPTTAPVPTVVPTAPPSPATVTTATAFPIGIFANSVGWTLEFKDDGRWLFQQRDIQDPGSMAYRSGTYTASGAQVMFSESAAVFSDCVGDRKDGTYTWTYDGTALKLEVLADRCGIREGTFASKTWTKKP